jgi:hypothetical protein
LDIGCYNSIRVSACTLEVLAAVAVVTSVTLYVNTMSLG